MSETNKLKELEYGDVKISNDVVAIIANIAAMEIEGVEELKGGIASDIAEVFGKKNNARGVKVNAEEKSVELDLSIIVKYGVKIPEVSWKIQEAVKSYIESMTDLTAKVVNIHVVGVDTKNRDAVTGDIDE